MHRIIFFLSVFVDEEDNHMAWNKTTHAIQTYICDLFFLDSDKKKLLLHFM